MTHLLPIFLLSLTLRQPVMPRELLFYCQSIHETLQEADDEIEIASEGLSSIEATISKHPIGSPATELFRRELRKVHKHLKALKDLQATLVLRKQECESDPEHNFGTLIKDTRLLRFVYSARACQNLIDIRSAQRWNAQFRISHQKGGEPNLIRDFSQPLQALRKSLAAITAIKEKPIQCNDLFLGAVRECLYLDGCNIPALRLLKTVNESLGDWERQEPGADQ